MRVGSASRRRATGTASSIVGSGMMVERIRGYFANDPTIEFVGAVDDDPKPGSPVVGSIEDVPRLCKELDIDRILIGFSRTHPGELVEQMRPLQGKVAISIVPRYFELLSWRSQVDDLCGLPMIDVAPAGSESLGSARQADRGSGGCLGRSRGSLAGARLLSDRHQVQLAGTGVVPPAPHRPWW